jgi:hypothetical protein
VANKNKLVCIFSQDMICIKFNHHGNEETRKAILFLPVSNDTILIQHPDSDMITYSSPPPSFKFKLRHLQVIMFMQMANDIKL